MLSVGFSVLNGDVCIYLRMWCVIIVKESTSTRNRVLFYVFKGTDSFFQAIECCDSSFPVCQVVHLSGKTRYIFSMYGMYFPHNLSLHPCIEAANSLESNVYFTMLYEKRRDTSTRRTDSRDNVSDLRSEVARFNSGMPIYIRTYMNTCLC